MLAALCLGWTVIYLNRTALYPLLPFMLADMSLSAAQAGAIGSAYFIFYVLLQIPAGMLGDAFGYKKVLLAMYTLSGIGLVGLGLWGSSYYSLIFFISLHGAGAGAYYSCASGILMATTEPDKRGFNFALLGVGMSMGLLLGLNLAMPLYNIGKQAHLVFLYLTIPTALILWGLYKAVPKVSGKQKFALADYKEILLDKNLWLINLATLSGLYGFWVLITWGSTFLNFERGIQLDKASMYISFMAVSSIVSAPILGKLSDTYGRRTMCVLTLLAATVSLAAFIVADSVTTQIITLLCFGLFANSAFTPIMAAWTSDIITALYPDKSGMAISVFNCILMLSAVIAPWLSGVMQDIYHSFVPSFYLSIVLNIVAIILALAIRRPKCIKT